MKSKYGCHGPADMPGVMFHGHRVMAIGGSTLRMPDEKANADFVLMNLTHNLSRIEVLIRSKVIGITRVGAPKICQGYERAIQVGQKHPNCSEKLESTQKSTIISPYEIKETLHNSAAGVLVVSGV